MKTFTEEFVNEIEKEAGKSKQLIRKAETNIKSIDTLKKNLIKKNSKMILSDWGAGIKKFTDNGGLERVNEKLRNFGKRLK